MGVIEFDTERLRLRQWKASDLEPFAALNADARVMEYFPAPLDRAASDGLVERIRTQLAERGWGLWAAEIRATGEFIGFIGLSVPKAELPFSPCVEIGWRLAFSYWGKGYATEAGRGVLRIGFERLELEEIVSFTSLLNRRSQAVMEKLGMRRIAETFEHPSVPEDNPLREHCLYKLARRDWLAASRKD